MIQLLTQNEIDILSYFYPRLEERTTKDLETISKKDHETTFRTLKGIVKKGLLIERKVGKTNVYKLLPDKPDYSVAFSIFVDYNQKRRLEFKSKHLLLYTRLFEFLSDFKLENNGIAVIFGSYSKGKETKQSDIDLLLITNRKDSEKSEQRFKTKYKIPIQTTCVRFADFKNIKKDNPEFWSDVIEYGIVLEGLDYFFKEAYRND